MRSSDGLFAFSSIAACLFALLPCIGAFDSPSLPQQSNHGKGEATTAKEKEKEKEKQEEEEKQEGGGGGPLGEPGAAGNHPSNQQPQQQQHRRGQGQGGARGDSPKARRR